MILCSAIFYLGLKPLHDQGQLLLPSKCLLAYFATTTMFIIAKEYTQSSPEPLESCSLNPLVPGSWILGFQIHTPFDRAAFAPVLVTDRDSLELLALGI